MILEIWTRAPKAHLSGRMGRSRETRRARTKSILGLASLSLLGALVFVSPPAAAQGTDNAALATELFNAGRDLMNAGNFAAACPKLAESARLDPKVGTFGKLAECEEKSNHLVAARARWLQAQNLARAQSDSRLDKVTAELERLDKIVPKVNLTFRGAPPADLAVKIDTLEVNAASLGTPIPVEPGQHTVTASASGRTPWTNTVITAADGATTEVIIPDLAPGASAPPPPPPNTGGDQPPPPPPRDAKKAGGGLDLRTVGMIGAGVGLVGVVVGSVFAIQAKSRFDDSNEKGCNGDNCTPAAAAIRNDARSSGNLATAFMIIGGVLVAGGGAMYFLAPSPAKTSAKGVQVSPGAIGWNGGGLTVRGAW